MLKTSEAWIEVAKRSRERRTGLCRQIDLLYYERFISKQKWLAMHESVREEVTRTGHSTFGHIWPLDEGGQRLRTKWARDMAEIYRREEERRRE